MLPKTEKVLYENLSCQKARLPRHCILFIHYHVHAIYGAGKVQTSRKTNQLTCQQIKLEFHTFTNSRKAETLPYERRLIINHRTHSCFFSICFLDKIFYHVPNSRGPRTTYCSACVMFAIWIAHVFYQCGVYLQTTEIYKDPSSCKHDTESKSHHVFPSKSSYCSIL